MGRSYTSAKKAHAGEPVTFELDGVTFTCHGSLSSLTLSEMARHEHADLEAPTPAMMAVLAEVFEEAMGNAEYARFRAHVRSHGTPDDTLTEIFQGLLEDILGRPTQRPSESSGGPSTTGDTSPVVSSSRVVSLQDRTVRIVGDTPGPGAAQAAIQTTPPLAWPPVASSR